MGFLLNGQPLRVGRPFTDADGVQYPSNWLRLASEADKAAIGITWEPDPAPVDTRFYWDHDLPKRLEDEPAVDENGDPVLDADGVQIINKGLKTEWIAKQKKSLAACLHRLIGTSPARLKLALKSRLLLPLTALQSAPPAAPARLKLTPAQPPKNWQHC
jgi:hypothetical protein